MNPETIISFHPAVRMPGRCDGSRANDHRSSNRDVTDANGALVPAATVQATDVATGRVFKTETTDAGIYLLPTLPVGKYSLSVEKQGFKTTY